jgi:hypothetical protein
VASIAGSTQRSARYSPNVIFCGACVGLLTFG